MKEVGVRNSSFGVETFGLNGLKAVYWNLNEPALYEHALTRGEARVAANGPLVADTGVHTGRSPKDKYVLRDATTENTVWWDNNQAMTSEQFETLLADFRKHAEGMELFAQDLWGGAEEAYRLPVRVYT
ncbi:MAG: phosphoenolpyruvate carboxykinase (ATP), partial [Gammaproteobacteria bacterium]|nr:phosphoenolpyruvate carboxykinase (ATP) [Gammaproteobacteria bacterium]